MSLIQNSWFDCLYCYTNLYYYTNCCWLLCLKGTGEREHAAAHLQEGGDLSLVSRTEGSQAAVSHLVPGYSFSKQGKGLIINWYKIINPDYYCNVQGSMERAACWTGHWANFSCNLEVAESSRGIVTTWVPWTVNRIFICDLFSERCRCLQRAIWVIYLDKWDDGLVYFKRVVFLVLIIALSPTWLRRTLALQEA